MKATLQSLMALQKVDNELDELEALKGDLPQQVFLLQDKLEQTRTRLDDKKSQLEETKRLKIHLEGEIADLKEKLNKYQEQLYSVTSNKEYDAITTEIDSVTEKMDEAETQVLELLEKEDGLTEEVKTDESAVATLQDDLQIKKKELDEKIKSTEKETQGFAKERGQITGAISKPVLYQYERIRKGLGNRAVVEISNYACGGCFTTMPPQKVVEIKTMSQLIMCESCGRILVFDRKDSAVATSAN